MQDVSCFGFGAPAPGQSYPSIYIVGWVNNVYGIWQSTNNAQSWTQIGTYPDSSLDQITTISGDPNIYGQVYVGFGGSGYAYLPATTTTPTVAVSINNTDVNVANPTGTVTFAFSAAPATFVLADTSAVGGTLSNLQKTDATHYTATFTGSANTDMANASVSVTAGSWQAMALPGRAAALPASRWIR